MISVIICSINEEFSVKVARNIEQTIGLPYELLIHDNRKNPKGICAVYNLLAARAKFEYLCFVHEDVEFVEKDWGNIIVKLFKEQGADAIGIAGAKYKSSYYSGWYTNNPSLDCARYTHQYPDHKEEVLLNPDKSSGFQEVVCLDGVFICCKKKVWEAIQFDEDRIPGFHFYDIDFTLRASKLFRILVTFEINLVHITSGGDYGNNWIKAAEEYHRNVPYKLPISLMEVPYTKADKRLVIGYLDFLKNFKISFNYKLKWIFQQNLHKNPLYYLPILKLFLYQPLGLKKILRKKNQQ